MYDNYNNAYTSTMTPPPFSAHPQKIATSTVQLNTEGDDVRHSYDLMNASDLEKALLHYDFIIVDVWAPWCKSCSHFSKRFETEIGNRYQSLIQKDRLLLLKDNIENEDSYHKTSYELHVVPTFFIYQKNTRKEVARFTGVEFNELLVFLDSLFSSPRPINTPKNTDISPINLQTLPPTPLPSPPPYDSFIKKQMRYDNFH